MNANVSLPRPTARYMQNRRWICDHIDDLVATHGNGWIAVDQGRVLAFGAELGEVVARARGQAPERDIAFQFIDDGTLIY